MDFIKYGKKLYYEDSPPFINEKTLTRKDKEKILVGYFTENVEDFRFIYSDDLLTFLKSLIEDNDNFLLLDNCLIKMNTKTVSNELEYIITKRYYRRHEILRLFYKYYEDLFIENNFGQSLFERYLLFNDLDQSGIDFFIEMITLRQLKKILNNKRIKKTSFLKDIYYDLLKKEIIKKEILELFFNEHLVLIISDH